MTNGRDGASPSVTAAVLAYNRRECLAVTLTKLHERLEPPDGGLEVIVVDNASTDGTAEMVRSEFPNVRLIVNPENEGIGGWNRAFAEGRGEWFLVLDDDCYVEGETLRRALEAAEEHGADMVSLGVDSADPEQSFSDWDRTGLIMFRG